MPTCTKKKSKQFYVYSNDFYVVFNTGKKSEKSSWGKNKTKF